MAFIYVKYRHNKNVYDLGSFFGNAYIFFEYADDSEHDSYSMESSYSWSYINSDGEVDYITSPSEYSILAMMIKDLLK